MVFNAIKGDFMKKWLLYCATLYALVVIPSLVFGQTPIASTRVNEALKAQLDSDGKWLSILFSDGSSQSTAGGSVTSVSVTTANGVSGSVSNPTTTPAISLVLGAITPSSVNAVVLSGSSLPNLTVTGTASVSGANTGDQTNITGNAATVTTNANLTGHVTSTGNAAVLGSFSSANLAGALSDETGSGAAVFGTAPTIQNVSLTGTFKGVTGYPLIQPITSDRRRFIENSDGIGSSAWAYNTPQQSSAITGTRTSDTIFTRSSGTWTINALVGQYVFSFATGVPATGVWLPITANTTTTLTVSGTLNATGTSVYTSPWSPIAATYAHGQGATAFVGGVFDGESIWLIPLASANLVKVNPATGVMTTYAHGQGATAFYGGIFDGESVWLVPNNSANLVKVNPATGVMTTYAHGQGATAFAGGVFDGGSVWLVPNNSANLVKVNPPRSGRGVTTGNRNFAGNLLVAGTITASMGYKFSDGSSITSGKEPFIQLSDSTNQEPGVTTPVLVTFDTQDAIEGMSHSGGTITAHRAGVYCIIAAGQVGKTQGATDIKYDMWLKKNTTYIANSGVRNTILTASDTKVVVQNTGIRLSAGDTINVYHSIDTTGDGAGLKVYNPAGEPRIPSIILTMYRIGD